MKDLKPETQLNFERHTAGGRETVLERSSWQRERLFYMKLEPRRRVDGDTSRPAWMEDPTLLPKRPPGARA